MWFFLLENMLRGQNSDLHQQTAIEYRELSYELTHQQFWHKVVRPKFEYYPGNLQAGPKNSSQTTVTTAGLWAEFGPVTMSDAKIKILHSLSDFNNNTGFIFNIKILLLSRNAVTYFPCLLSSENTAH